MQYYVMIFTPFAVLPTRDMALWNRVVMTDAQCPQGVEYWPYDLKIMK